MSIDTCKCGKHVDTDFSPEFYREEFNFEGMCDACYDRKLEDVEDDADREMGIDPYLEDAGNK